MLLLLLSDPFAFKPIPESRGCKAAGFLLATGRLAGGCGGVGLLRAAVPFAAGGGGGALGTNAGGGVISSTYAAGTQACPEPFLASHHPEES